MEFTVESTRTFPSARPDRAGKTDRLVVVRLSPSGVTHTLVLPEESSTPKHIAAALGKAAGNDAALLAGVHQF